MSSTSDWESSGADCDVPAVTRRRVLVAGASGYIGRHVARELVIRGHEVVCLVRKKSGINGTTSPEQLRSRLAGCELRFGDITCEQSLLRDGFRGERFDAVVSCLASRNGGIADSWDIDYQASRQLLDKAVATGVKQFVLLSAICVQKPRLAFQQAKLKMEQALIESGINYSIVRPTAFFKSIAGQIEAVRNGRPYMLFGDSDAACKPIGEADLAAFMADCLEDRALQNRILPVGGPDEAMTARERGELLFTLLGQQPKFREVPVGLLKATIPVLDGLGRLLPGLREKAEFARIGHYYATESMLVLNSESGDYDAAATPSYGRQTLRDFYLRVLEQGMAGQELGDHAVFARNRKNPGLPH